MIKCSLDRRLDNLNMYCQSSDSLVYRQFGSVSVYTIFDVDDVVFLSSETKIWGQQ